MVVEITKKIDILREKINKIDKEILSLVLKRQEIVAEIGIEKNNKKNRVYIPERENYIFKTLSNSSTLSFNEIKNLYTEIISFCRKSESILTIFLLNTSSSLLALKKIFGEYVQFELFNSTYDIFQNSFNCKYILLPLSEDLILFLKNSNFEIINSISIDNTVFFLISTYHNTIKNENDNLYILSTYPINNSSLKFNNLFFSKILRKNSDILNYLHKVVGFTNN